MKTGYLVAIFFLLLITTACNSNHDKRHIKKPKYQVTKALVKDTLISRDYVCQIRSVQHIDLRALEKGYLDAIHVDEGQEVKAGQVLFEVMPRLYEAELSTAKASTQFAEIEYINTARLAEKKVVAPTELLLAKAKLDKAKAYQGLKEVHLDFTKIKAPFDGIIGRFFVRKGSLVEQGAKITTLSDNKEMWVYFNVPEAEYLEYVRSGTSEDALKIRLEMADHSFYQEKGTITALEADFDNQTGNISYRATFPNPNKILRHGQTGKVWIDTIVKEAVVVPQKAVFEILDKHYIYVVDKSGKVKSKEITIKNILTNLYLIDTNIAENQYILLEGQRKVHDGSTIDLDYIEPKKLFSELSVHSE